MSASTNGLGGCDYVPYEELEPIDLPTSPGDQVANHTDSLKERLENQDDWKEQFAALTEIQRIAKYQPSYLSITNPRNRPSPLELWFGPILTCVISLRSSLCKNALHTLSALANSNDARQHVLALLVRHSPRVSPIASPTDDNSAPPKHATGGGKPTSRLIHTFGTLLSRACSPSGGQFIQEQAVEVACQLAKIPRLLEILLPHLHRLAKENSRNSRYLLRVTTIAAAGWEEECARRLAAASQDQTSIDVMDLEAVLLSVGQIAAAAVGDKSPDTRAKGKMLLKLMQDFAESYEEAVSKDITQTDSCQLPVLINGGKMTALVKRVFETLSSSMQAAARAAFHKSLPYCESHSCSAVGQHSRLSPSMRLKAPPLRSRILSDFGTARQDDTMLGAHKPEVTASLPTFDAWKCASAMIESEDRRRGRQTNNYDDEIPYTADPPPSTAQQRDRSPSLEYLGPHPNCVPCPESESIWSESSPQAKVCDVNQSAGSQRPSSHGFIAQSRLTGGGGPPQQNYGSRVSLPLGRHPSLSRIPLPSSSQPQQQPSRPRSCRPSLETGQQNVPPTSNISSGVDGWNNDSGRNTDSSVKSGSMDGSSRRCQGNFPLAPCYTRFPLGQAKPKHRLHSRERSGRASDSMLQHPPRPSSSQLTVRRPLCPPLIRVPHTAQIGGDDTEPPYNHKWSGQLMGGQQMEGQQMGCRSREASLTGALRRVPSISTVTPQQHSGDHQAYVMGERTALGGIRGVIPKAPVRAPGETPAQAARTFPPNVIPPKAQRRPLPPSPDGLMTCGDHDRLFYGKCLVEEDMPMTEEAVHQGDYSRRENNSRWDQPVGGGGDRRRLSAEGYGGAPSSPKFRGGRRISVERPLYAQPSPSMRGTGRRVSAERHVHRPPEVQSRGGRRVSTDGQQQQMRAKGGMVIPRQGGYQRKQSSLVDRPPRYPCGAENGRRAESKVPPLNFGGGNSPRDKQRGRCVANMENTMTTISTAAGSSFRAHFRSRSLTGNRAVQAPDDRTMAAFASKFGFVDSATSEGE